MTKMLAVLPVKAVDCMCCVLRPRFDKLLRYFSILSRRVDYLHRRALRRARASLLLLLLLLLLLVLLLRLLPYTRGYITALLFSVLVCQAGTHWRRPPVIDSTPVQHHFYSFAFGT